MKNQMDNHNNEYGDRESHKGNLWYSWVALYWSCTRNVLHYILDLDYGQQHLEFSPVRDSISQAEVTAGSQWPWIKFLLDSSLQSSLQSSLEARYTKNKRVRRNFKGEDERRRTARKEWFPWCSDQGTLHNFTMKSMKGKKGKKGKIVHKFGFGWESYDCVSWLGRSVSPWSLIAIFRLS